MPGGPVFELADLDRPSNPLICTTCVHAVAKPTLLRPGARRPERAPAPPRPANEPSIASPAPKADAGTGAKPAPADEPGQSGDEAVAADDVRKDLRTVTQLLEAQQRELTTLSEAVLETRAELRSATESHRTLAQSQRELDTRMVAMAEQSQQVRSGAVASSATERDLRHNLQFVTELLQAQQRELAELSAAMAETRNDLHVVRESHQTLARSQVELQQRLVDLAPTESPSEEPGRLTESLERALQDMDARLAGGLEQSRADAANLVAQLRAEVGSLAKAIEGRIHRFEAEGDAGARAQLGGLARTVGDLQTSSQESSSRLEALQHELEEVATKLAWLSSAERTFAPAANHEAGAVSEPAARGGLLDALEQQLQDAEGRLARLSGPSYE